MYFTRNSDIYDHPCSQNRDVKEHESLARYQAVLRVQIRVKLVKTTLTLEPLQGNVIRLLPDLTAYISNTAGVL